MCGILRCWLDNMTTAQVCVRLAIKAHCEMFSFITVSPRCCVQLSADWSRWMWVESSFLCHKTTATAFQRSERCSLQHTATDQTRTSTFSRLTSKIIWDLPLSSAGSHISDHLDQCKHFRKVQRSLDSSSICVASAARPSMRAGSRFICGAPQGFSMVDAQDCPSAAVDSTYICVLHCLMFLSSLICCCRGDCCFQSDKQLEF